ncbi:MAG: UDP-N-acetylmuramoyl-L-alanine--D-glutamate ligase [Spirochaetia bacterium]
MKADLAAIPGMRVTVMGLGIHGGGLASALFFARRGARVTVTDLRSREVLRDPIEQLREYSIRYVLERHDEADFAGADLVIKNPAVPPSSPYLQVAHGAGVDVETDLSVFLSLAKNPILAVTGSKGKSTTASAIAFCLARVFPEARLGGNITVSPLAFVDDLSPDAPVVLELSSWQLGDLKGRGLLTPVVSAFTLILPDHLDKYPGMEEYVADKTAIFQEQGPAQNAIFNLDDPWQQGFPAQTRARPFFYSARALPRGMCGAWLEEAGGRSRVAPGGAEESILGASRIPGAHNRMNLLCAGLALRLFGVTPDLVRAALAEFPGVEHRLEMFREWEGIRFYNDSAATIPHATVQALKALQGPIVLITGGTDKNIDFSPLAETARIPRTIVLLAGTGTGKIRAVLDAQGVRYEGPFGSLGEAVDVGIARARDARTERGVSILFSPGCASFGMFLNEFDRGKKFKETVTARIATGPFPETGSRQSG